MPAWLIVAIGGAVWTAVAVWVGLGIAGLIARRDEQAPVEPLVSQPAPGLDSAVLQRLREDVQRRPDTHRGAR